MDLQSRRMQAGYTQRDLAKLCGITQGRLSQIERGKDAEVTASTLYRLSKVLGFRMEEWFEEVHD